MFNRVTMNRSSPATVSRRTFIARMGGLAAACALPGAAFGQTGRRIQPIDATFLFIADIHACRMAGGPSPGCLKEGKTDAALLRNVAALNALADKEWPTEINGLATGLHAAGSRIGASLGLVT